MQFIAMIYADEGTWDAFSDEERESWYERYRALGREAEGAGVLAGGNELASTRDATTVRVRSDDTLVTDGPYAEVKEALGGFYVFDCESMDEALEWARRCPDPMPGEESVLEIRPVFEAEDFGKQYTPELRAQDERLRSKIESQRQS